MHPIVEDNEKRKCKYIKDDPRFRSAIIEFIHEWNKLRPIEKRKLSGKPLQLPLSNELCYLNESLNHDNEVCTCNIFSILGIVASQFQLTETCLNTSVNC